VSPVPVYIGEQAHVYERLTICEQSCDAVSFLGMCVFERLNDNESFKRLRN